MFPRIVLTMRLSRAPVFYHTKRWFQMHSFRGPTKEEVNAVRQDLFGNLVQENIRLAQHLQKPLINNVDVKVKRSELFSKEKERQLQAVGRVEKIQIDYVSMGEHPEDCSLLMNKNISTPYHCAQHLSEVMTNRTAIAEVNGKIWDMHRPLEESCKLRLLSLKLKTEDPFHVNRVFWRSCSMMLGCVLERAFRDHIYIELHSFPAPNVRSGSFVYDADLKLPNWKPNADEMRVLSAEMRKLSLSNLHFERLEVSKDLALEIFQDNQYKSQQIPEIAASSHDGKSVCLYRIGDFVDVSRGPMMSHTGLLGRCTITACFPILGNNVSETLYRLQGVALPSEFLLNHFAYSLIEERGRKMNSARLPGIQTIAPVISDSNIAAAISDSNIAAAASVS